MALETLKKSKTINGHLIQRVEWNHPEQSFIEINDKDNAITFKIQDGPIKENGVNGCQVETIIETALIMIYGLNEKFPCEENESALNFLCLAMTSLKQRTENRQNRGVEGTRKN